jgi:uncharacterized membrane protein YfcA
MTIFALASYLATGAAAGVLAGLLGIGGGVVIVPVLILVFSEQGLAAEWAPHLAVGTSLTTIVGTGAAAVRAHHRRRAVRWGLVRTLAPGIVVGAWIGALVAGVLPADWLRRVFALFLVLVGVQMLVDRSVPGGQGTLPSKAGLLAAGTGIGALSSLVGIGGGSLTVPFLARAGVDLRAAVATSSACGVPLALAGAIGFAVVGLGRTDLPALTTGFIYWPAVVCIWLTSLPAAPLGARLAHNLPVPLLKRLFAVLLLGVAARLLAG